MHPDVLAKVQTSEHATKSILLEIAKEPDPVRQAELWEMAGAGKLTVKGARQAKKNGAAKEPKQARVVIELADASVAVKFRSGEATASRVCEALELALSMRRGQS